MFNNIARHFREAFHGITRHFTMALSSASAVSITLVLIGTVMLVSANISHITRNIEQNVEIMVKIDNSAPQVAIDYLEGQIKSVEGVLSTTFSSKDNELEKFITSYGDSYAIYRGANNPMRNAFYVKVEKGVYLQEISDRIKSFQYVEETNYGGINTVSMVTTMNAINMGGFIAAGIFSLLAIFLINNTIKITIYGRNKEITIMRHVGATNNFIRIPFVIEGIFIGILGSVFPIIIVILGYRYLFDVLKGHLFTNLLAMAPVMPLIMQISATLLGIGCIVGLLGSFISVTRYLRFKR